MKTGVFFMKKLFLGFAMAMGLLAFANNAPMKVEASEVQAPAKLATTFNLNTDNEKTISNNSGELTIKKHNNPLVQTRMADDVYDLYYHSFDGKFNCGYRAVIANNMFIDVDQPWNDLYGMDVLYQTLGMDSSTKATYFMNVENCWGQNWNQYLVGEIDYFGMLNVRMFHN